MSGLPLRHLSVKHVDGVAVVQFLESELVEREHVDRAGQELVSLVEPGGERKILLHFGNIRRFSSHALGKLVTMKKSVDAARGTLMVCAIHPDFRKIFEIIRFDEIFRIFPDEPSALAEFARERPPAGS